WLFRSGRFLSGLTLTILGTLGLALLRADLHKMEVNRAVLLVLLAAAAWAVYSVSVKRPAAELGSTVSFAGVSVFTTAGLLVPALLWGNFAEWLRAPWWV